MAKKQILNLIEQIGVDLRHRRAMTGLTQTELAAQFNAAQPRSLTTTHVAISAYERGLARMSVDKYVKMLCVLDKLQPTIPQEVSFIDIFKHGISQ